jgi:hypothetical protein
MMKNTFKPTQNNQKQHNRNVIDLLAYALAHADRGTLFTPTNRSNIPEIVVGGEQNGVVTYDTPGKFSLPRTINGNKIPQKHAGWKVRTRIVKVQSPGDGAYAFVVKTGRDLEITAYCNRMKEEGGSYYFCEASWKQGEENLGNIQYRIDSRLVTLED